MTVTETEFFYQEEIWLKSHNFKPTMMLDLTIFSFSASQRISHIAFIKNIEVGDFGLFNVFVPSYTCSKDLTSKLVQIYKKTFHIKLILMKL